MKTLAIIPARYLSTRFPGKPLAIINGISMIQRVYRQVEKANSITLIAVATDDDRIFDHVISFGGNAIMTSASHTSGTDRCLEALLYVQNNQGFIPDFVINIQGDEPFINHQVIDSTVNAFQHSDADIVTMKQKIESYDELFSADIVKVATSISNKALYFSRSTIPHLFTFEKKKMA